MRQFTSEAAKSLITIIGTEYRMGQIRVDRNFIDQDKMLGCLFERLNLLACQNINLRKFLDNTGHIPIEEDERMDLAWARDPRDDEDTDPPAEGGLTPSDLLRRFQGPEHKEPKQYVTRDSGNILNSDRRVSKKKTRTTKDQK